MTWIELEDFDISLTSIEPKTRAYRYFSSYKDRVGIDKSSKFLYDIDSFVSSKHKIRIKYKETGEVYEQYPSGHIRSYPKGLYKNPMSKSLEDYLEDFKGLYGSKYDYSEATYINSREPIKIYCTDCRDYFYMSPDNHRRGRGCLRCYDKRRTKTTEEFVSEASIFRPEYDFSRSKYITNKHKVEVICKEHGSFWIKPNNLLNGQGCSRCAVQERLSKLSRVSNKESELASFIASRISIEQSIYPPWLVLSDSPYPKELDIFIPSLRLAIEYNGTYWHSTSKKFRDYHKEKYEVCKANNIDLIHVFEFENINKWKKRLANYLVNPGRYYITFSNNKRTIGANVVYGQSCIKRHH